MQVLPDYPTYTFVIKTDEGKTGVIILNATLPTAFLNQIIEESIYEINKERNN